jgi:streptogrisin C
VHLKRKLTVVTSAALLSPLALAVSTSPASAASLCDGYDHPTTRTIHQGQTDTPWSYVWTPNPGTYSLCLDGPAGTNLDLVMKRWDDAASQWVTVANSESPGPDEKLTYTETLGSTAYLVYVTAVRGSGDYTLAFNHTPAG